MTCNEITPELVGYHFATLDDEARARVESHLLECPACVRAFVELKRGIETSEAAERPSDLARTRLRRAVEGELGLRRRWWERPLAIALAASVVLVAGRAMHALTASAGSAPYALHSSAGETSPR